MKIVQSESYKKANYWSQSRSPESDSQMHPFVTPDGKKQYFNARNTKHQNIDQQLAKQYGIIGGLEGPIQLASGKVVYYDPHKGKYYDREADRYMELSDYEAHNRERPNPHIVAASKKKKKGRCWKGYEPTPGKEPYSDGSCRPKD